MPAQALLLSIRPRFADMIFAGTKTVELRRTRPRVGKGDLVLVYVSAPVKSLVGAFLVATVIETTPGALWKRAGRRAGVTKVEFDAYFIGATNAFGIELCCQWKLEEPAPLATLRNRRRGFHPPQVYRYLSQKDLAEWAIPNEAIVQC